MTDPTIQEDEYYTQRTQKILTRLINNDKVYPHKFHLTTTLKTTITKYGNLNTGEHSSDTITSAGRVVAIRKVGKLNFYKIFDDDTFLQVVVHTGSEKNNEDKKVSDGNKEEDFIHFDAHTFSSAVDLFKRGDIIGFSGTPGRTKTGELSIFATSLFLLAPCLRTLPVEHFGIKDSETLYRKRYLDLMLNPISKQRFIARAKAIKYIRTFLDDRDFLEVETPMMNQIPGGGAAKPFVTHHNELKLDLFMRISPELYLKQLVIGGMNRVYELGKEYRNEGIDLTHNPEFTSCEFYMAYNDYNDLMDMTEEMLSGMAGEICGSEKVEYWPEKREERPDKVVIDFSRPFRRIDIVSELNKNIKERMDMWKSTGDLTDKISNMCIDINVDPTWTTNEFIDSFNLTPANISDMIPFLVFFLHREGIRMNRPFTAPRILDKIIGEYIEPQCTNPTFVMNHPLVMSPLAKKHRDNEYLTERFELFINGKEICNAYTELNDPFDQRERFEEQVKDIAEGDDEAMRMDKGFVTALEYGLVPTAGWGIGIDRLVMFLTNAANIRDVILFPAMKPEEDRNK